jgi:hypothetical protein
MVSPSPQPVFDSCSLVSIGGCPNFLYSSLPVRSSLRKLAAIKPKHDS